MEPEEGLVINYREDKSSAGRPFPEIAEVLAGLLAFGLAAVGRFLDNGRFFFRFFTVAIVIWLISVFASSGSGGGGYTGIQVTPEGVAIGGIRFAERRSLKARRRRAIVPLQHSQVFFCPWNGIREIYVEEDRGWLRKAAGRAVYGHGRTELGNLSVQWMRAALVVRVDLSVAALPEIRRNQSTFWFAQQKGTGFQQELWIAPTRRPAELRRVLTEASEAGLLRSDS